MTMPSLLKNINQFCANEIQNVGSAERPVDYPGVQALAAKDERTRRQHLIGLTDKLEADMDCLADCVTDEALSEIELQSDIADVFVTAAAMLDSIPSSDEIKAVVIDEALARMHDSVMDEIEVNPARWNDRFYNSNDIDDSTPASAAEWNEASSTLKWMEIIESVLWTPDERLAHGIESGLIDLIHPNVSSVIGQTEDLQRFAFVLAKDGPAAAKAHLQKVGKPILGIDPCLRKPLRTSLALLLKESPDTGGQETDSAL